MRKELIKRIKAIRGEEARQKKITFKKQLEVDIEKEMQTGLKEAKTMNKVYDVITKR